MAARVEKKVVFAVRAQEMEGRAEKKGDRLSDNGRDVGVEENSEEENDCRETTADQRVDAEAEEDRGGEEEEESESAHDHDLERAGHASWVVRGFCRACLPNSHHHGSATLVPALPYSVGCGRTPCTTPWLTIHQCRPGESCTGGAQTHNCVFL